MKKYSFVFRAISIVFIFVLALSAVSHTVFADGLTATGSTTGTDNLMGATSASWKFTATTTNAISVGSIVRFTFPNPQQATPFTVTGATIAFATSTTYPGFNLYQSTSSNAVAGLLTASGPNGPIVYGYSTTTQSLPANTVFTLIIGTKERVADTRG